MLFVYLFGFGFGLDWKTRARKGFVKFPRTVSAVALANHQIKLLDPFFYFLFLFLLLAWMEELAQHMVPGPLLYSGKLCLLFIW